MIVLHPVPDASYDCAYCRVSLLSRGWYIPGMRNLAEVLCPKCGRLFYADLPTGHGLFYPMLLEKETGIVHDEQGASWFSTWLKESYARPVKLPIPLQVEQFKQVAKPVLLNCLDGLYGHCLLKLLNAQYYLDNLPDFDLVVLVPKFLRWMVPRGVAAVWTLDLPLSRGKEWNVWLAGEIRRLLGNWERCWLAVAVTHPFISDFQIERLTGIKPFPLEEWADRLDRPTFTFVWREDRFWKDARRGAFSRMMSFPWKAERGSGTSLIAQQRKVLRLGEIIRQAFPRAEFAVAGLGSPGGLPGWIKDLRKQQCDPSVERGWCELYGQSHVVIGVHGSNMLLPSAHAGATIELVPRERWGNLLQDLLVPSEDAREYAWRIRALPLSASPEEVADVLTAMVRDLPFAMVNFQRRWISRSKLEEDPWSLAKVRLSLCEKVRRSSPAS